MASVASLLPVLLPLLCGCAAGDTRVHVIFMNHLDVGYNGIKDIGYINNILNVYFHQHYPQAVRLAKQMRQQQFAERFRYTTHPWLLDMYLNCPDLRLNNIRLLCPNATDLAAMRLAIAEGDVEWHAGPMNMQLENMERELMEAALNISRRLDAEYRPSKRLRVLSQRDVPGMTSAAIPALLRNGVLAVSVGVNAASYPPEVTREPFLWLDAASGQSLVGIWHPGGYPNNPGDSPAKPGGISVRDCSMISGVPEILCFSFRTDNQGPPDSVAEVLSTYEILRNQFPGARIFASTLEDFVQAVLPHKDLMQVVKTEIGDTWIQGIASDPRKMAEYRALSRAFTACRGRGQCQTADARVKEAVRYLIKPPEHTWGLPGQPDEINYRNADFERVRAGEKFLQNENAWSEQREFNSLSLAAAAGHQLGDYMRHELRQLRPDPPSLSGLVPDTLRQGASYVCGRYTFSFHEDGSIDRLQVDNGASYASEQDRLGRFVYRTYDELDDNKLLNSYGNPGYGKPNVTVNAEPISAVWPQKVVQFYRRRDNCAFVVELQPQDPRATVEYGAPQSVFLSYNFSGNVDIELVLWNKTSTRLEEATFLEFRVAPEATPPEANCRWYLNKLDGYVDPLRVTYGGSVLQHAVADHALLLCPSASPQRSLVVQSKDVPLVCPFTRQREASPFPYLDRLDRIDGVSFNVHNNVWITNYVYWYPFRTEDANFKARFSLKISS